MFVRKSLLFLFLPLIAWADPPELVSLKTGGAGIVNQNVQHPRLNKLGDVLAFESIAGGIVAEKPNLGFGVYVRNFVTNTTILVSKSAQGVVANDASTSPKISDDGTVVVFDSLASNLVPNVSGGSDRLYAKNIVTGAIECVSRNSAGTPIDFNNFVDGFAISGDARYVAFVTEASGVTPDDTSPHADVFVYDRETQSIELISKGIEGGSGNGDSSYVRISSNGRYVAFSSRATNLIGNDKTNGNVDVFVRDRKLGKTVLVSRNVAGKQQAGDCRLVGMSRNGKYVVLDCDESLDPALPLHDFFVVTRTGGDVEAVAPGKTGLGTHHDVDRAQITNDGRYVVFDSLAPGIAKLDDFASGYDAYVHDRKTHKTRLLSSAVPGQIPNGQSRMPVLSGDGRTCAFYSEASNLVANDPDAWRDIFMVEVH